MSNTPYKVTPTEDEDFIVASLSPSIDECEYNLFCSAGEIIEVLRIISQFDNTEFKEFCEQHEYEDCEELSRY